MSWSCPVLWSVLALALANCAEPGVAANWTVSGTVSSGDGEVQIKTDSPSGKVTILRPTPLEMEAVRRRADAGDTAAQIVLSQVEYALKNEAQGEKWLRCAANLGNINAVFQLGDKLTFHRQGPPRLEEGALCSVCPSRKEPYLPW